MPYSLFSYILGIDIISNTSYLENMNLYNYLIEPTDTGDSNSSSQGFSSNGKALVLVSAITAGAKLAQQMPTAAGKIAVLTTTVGLSAIGVGAINLADKASTSNAIKPNNFIDNQAILTEMLNLTGNTYTDLLILLQALQSFQWFILLSIFYNLFFYFINESKLESLILKILPSNITAFILK